MTRLRDNDQARREHREAQRQASRRRRARYDTEAAPRSLCIRRRDQFAGMVNL